VIFSCYSSERKALAEFACLLRLNDFKTQETYYNRIVERYMKFCAASHSADDLQHQFALLSLKPENALLQSHNPLPDEAVSRPSSALNSNAPHGEDIAPVQPESPTPKDGSSPELQVIHAAMRKLREAIVASRRLDSFAQRAYVFIIRAAILARSWEAYQPAILYLLEQIHRQCPLPASELNEFAAYHVLDLACRQSDFNSAFMIRLAYHVKEWRVNMVLRSLISDDWVMFWRMRNRVDGYQRCLMSWAEDKMRLHVLKCLGRTYFTAKKAFVEKATEKSWEELIKNGIGWELKDANTVIIRKPKSK
jgi:hypothetical protein